MKDSKTKTITKSQQVVIDGNSKTRVFIGIPRIIIKTLLVVFSLLSIYIVFLSPFDTRVNRSLFVGYIVFLIYLMYPIRHTNKITLNYIPIYDIILAVLAAFCYGYFAVNCKQVITVGIRLSPFMLAIGAAGIILTLEACRRATGIPIVIVALAFLIYGLINNSYRQVVYDVFYTTEGVIGTPIRACTAFISLFVIFGAFLERTGISDFFINLANSLVGHSSGGPAKVSVISSALCGMVSGSSVGNTVTTGSITIPLMKKHGYKPEFAGAVEAAASTGGQIMPPIMGAAAFLMVEYTSMPYSYIALRACLPALLYFAGIFVSVHLEAKKHGLKGMPKNDLPKFSEVIKSWYLVIPLIVLTVLIIKSTMSKAAIIAIIIAVTISVARDIIIDNSKVSDLKKEAKENHLLKITKATPILIANALEAGAKSVVSVGIACSVAGVIACIITTTGVGTDLVSGIVSLSNGNLMLCMFLTMITCIILGMGVPTTANYVIMATTCAPILIKMGMNPFAANMFVFYFGVVADITPPVALAAYAGSAIANASPMKTAINATLLAIAAFIVPYIFGLNPAMLFIDTNALQVIGIIITSLMGIFAVSAGIRGFVIRPMSYIESILMIVGGLLLIYPGIVTDAIGIAIIISLLIMQKKIPNIKI